MRSVEEIKADIKDLEASPSFYGNEWKAPKRGKLQAELFRSLTASIPLDRLEQLCNAEREGKVVVLPCKVGDTVKATVLRPYNGHEAHIQGEVIGIAITDAITNKIFIRVVYNQCRYIDFLPDDFGKTVFLTRAAALAALAGDGEARG